MVEFSGNRRRPFDPIFKVKTANQSITDSTLTNDTHLQVSVSSATRYAVEAMYMSSFTTNGIPGFKWSVPAGGSLRGTWSYEAGGSSFVASFINANSTFLLTTGDPGTGVHFSGFCITSSVAGTIVPQFRQQTADATATVFEAGSWLRVTRTG